MIHQRDEGGDLVKRPFLVGIVPLRVFVVPLGCVIDTTQGTWSEQ